MCACFLSQICKYPLVLMLCCSHILNIHNTTLCAFHWKWLTLLFIAFPSSPCCSKQTHIGRTHPAIFAGEIDMFPLYLIPIRVRTSVYKYMFSINFINRRFVSYTNTSTHTNTYTTDGFPRTTLDLTHPEKRKIHDKPNEIGKYRIKNENKNTISFK